MKRRRRDERLLRALDQFLDFGRVREHLEPYYSDIGRPSVDPELMIRMLLVGYCYGIRSERRLCEEICCATGFFNRIDPKRKFGRMAASNSNL